MAQLAVAITRLSQCIGENIAHIPGFRRCTGKAWTEIFGGPRKRCLGWPTRSCKRAVLASAASRPSRRTPLAPHPSGHLRYRRRRRRYCSQGSRTWRQNDHAVVQYPERRPLLYLPGPARCGHFHHYPPHGGSSKLIPERCTEHPCPTTLEHSVTPCRVETMAERRPPCRGRDDDARASKGRVHYLSDFSSREPL